MTTIITATLLASGIATRYNPGVMDPVVANRARWGHIDLSADHIGYVALLDREQVGKVVWLELPKGRVYGPLMVADCAAAHDRQWNIDRGWAVDLSWEVAQELGVVDAPLDGVKVWDRRPPRPRRGRELRAR